MGHSDGKKNQKSSLWTTTLEDIDKDSLPTDQDIEKAIQNVKDSKVDINKPIPEVERLKKIFEPKPYKWVYWKIL